MPIIATNVASGTFLEIKELVEQQAYASVEQFVEIALLNQIALERGGSPDGLEKGRRPTSRRSSGGARPGARAATGRRKGKTRPRGSKPASRKRTRSIELSPEDLELARRRLGREQSMRPGPNPLDASPRPADERLWGQVNRLLPMKIACRWVAVATAGCGEWPRLEELFDPMADDAATIGTALERADARAQRKRDQQLATSLPRRGNTPSRDRFLSQYVARMTRAGDIYPGAICQYAFAAFDGDHLSLTEKGLALARFVNPVLDQDIESADKALGEDEKALFVQQVLSYVPGEHADFRTVLQVIVDGHRSPKELAGAVRSHFPEDWSAGMFQTHTSGVIARLTEMDLIEREWQGRNVSYSATEAGRRIADSHP